MVEVQESLGTVDVVEWGEASGASIDGHGMNPQLPSICEEDPVRLVATHKHLDILRKLTKEKTLVVSNDIMLGTK